MNARIILFVLMLAHAAEAQTFSETVAKELTFEKRSQANALVVANIFGGIKVIAYEGDKVLVEATKTIRAKTAERLEKGKAELQLGIIDRADTLILFVRDGCHEFEKRTRDSHAGWKRNSWGYQSDRNGCSPLFDYKMDFTVKVPRSLNLVISTINDGNIVVENVEGTVRASNVNGGIALKNLRSGADAHTVNGDVDIEYAASPAEDCSFYTLNGDINAIWLSRLSATISFKSFNGEFYTNLDGLERLAPLVEKTSRGDGLKYKIDGNHYRIGSGGAKLAFETFNGNLYLKEKNK